MVAAMTETVVRLLVTGGRDFSDREAVYAALNAANHKRTIKVLIHGGATGADSLADDWARGLGIELLPFPVLPQDWKLLGKKAGPLRNQRMLDHGKPDGVIAFPGGAGTNDMLLRARLAKLPVWEPYSGRKASAQND